MFRHLAAATLTAVMSAQPVLAQSKAGQVIQVAVPSASLGANRIGDPATDSVSIYLPPSYESSPARRYPAVFLLHGYGPGRARHQFGVADSPGFQGMFLSKMLDSLSASGATREFIVVVPNGQNRYGGGFYSDSPVTGGWDTFISQDLVGWVDAHYRTEARPEARGIAGHSMGGYGALMLAMTHPDVFGAVYAMSPCCLGFEGDLAPDSPAWTYAFRYSTWDDVPKGRASGEEFVGMLLSAMGAAVSPQGMGTPLAGNLPFKSTEGRVVPSEPSYSMWRSRMPLHALEAYRSNLLQL